MSARGAWHTAAAARARGGLPGGSGASGRALADSAGTGDRLPVGGGLAPGPLPPRLAPRQRERAARSGRPRLSHTARLGVGRRREGTRLGLEAAGISAVSGPASRRELSGSARGRASTESITRSRLSSSPAALMLATRQLATRRAWRLFAQAALRMFPPCAPSAPCHVLPSNPAWSSRGVRTHCPSDWGGGLALNEGM
jgi:hypothetical protein